VEAPAPARERLHGEAVALALDEHDGPDAVHLAAGQPTASRSTTKTSGSLGLITPPPAPRSP
jgi:hypothetical protein